MFFKSGDKYLHILLPSEVQVLGGDAVKTCPEQYLTEAAERIYEHCKHLHAKALIDAWQFKSYSVAAHVTVHSDTYRLTFCGLLDVMYAECHEELLQCLTTASYAALHGRFAVPCEVNLPRYAIERAATWEACTRNRNIPEVDERLLNAPLQVVQKNLLALFEKEVST